jgi:hypothetical protein
MAKIAPTTNASELKYFIIHLPLKKKRMIAGEPSQQSDTHKARRPLLTNNS